MSGLIEGRDNQNQVQIRPWEAIMIKVNKGERVFGSKHALEESLWPITTLRCDWAIATLARKMDKKIFVVVHPEVLDND